MGVMTGFSIVLVTLPSVEKAAELARTLVEERLAACGNILPGVRSIYSWEGRVQDEQEVLLILKTASSSFDALRQRVASLHPYSCPEVISLEITEGHAPYLEWIRQNVGPLGR